MSDKHPLEEIMTYYIDELDVAVTTEKKYRRILRAYIRHLKGRSIPYAEPADLIRYKRKLINRGLKAKSVQNILVVIRDFYRWIRINRRMYGFDENYAYDIAAALKPMRTTKTHKTDPLSLSEVKGLLEIADKKCDTLHGLRNYCALLLMVTTGMRVAEILRAEKKDYKKVYGQHVLFVREGLTEKSGAFIKLSKPVRHAINEYLFLRNDEHERLFIAHDKRKTTGMLSEKALNGALRDLLRRAGVTSDRKTLRSLRHACAVFSLRTGGTLYQTMRLMRHQSIKSTLVYLKRMQRLNDESEERIAGHITNKEEKEDE